MLELVAFDSNFHLFFSPDAKYIKEPEYSVISSNFLQWHDYIMMYYLFICH